MAVDPADVLFESELKSLDLVRKGKVRDVYAVDDHTLLIVASDRLSAFDVVLPTPIPGKGRVLTQLSNFWFERTRDVMPNHLVDMPLVQAVPNTEERRRIEGRAVVTRRLTPLPIEAIVRGYIVGSGWKEYQTSGTVCGIELPDGLQQAQQLPEPIFTPSTKAEVGDHDENISFDKAIELVGREVAEQVREASLKIYREAAEYAAGRGIIIADTKMEFGLDAEGDIVLIDELLTPDSSRFWPADAYTVGANPPSFDKQYVRDWLEDSGWDKTAPGPKLPDEVARKTGEKYQEAFERLVG